MVSQSTATMGGCAEDNCNSASVLLELKSIMSVHADSTLTNNLIDTELIVTQMTS